MTVKYTPEDRSDIEGILMSALSDSFRDRYIDLLSAYCRIAGDDFCLYTADIHSCNVDQNVLTRESVNLYAVKVQPEMRFGGYTLGQLGIDFTARDLQNKLKEKGLPWEKAKAFDGSAVVGNFLDKNNFQSIENINFGLFKNGEQVQSSYTSLMLYKIDEIIAYVSQFFTLKTGDLLFTGTPKGVAAVNPNDILEGYIEQQ